MYTGSHSVMVCEHIQGGLTARLAWPRLANYFARFGLCWGISCSLEVMAATLTNVPLFVRPPREQQRQRLQQQTQQQQLLLEAAVSSSQAHEPTSQEAQEDEAKEEENWGGVFDDQEEEEAHGDATCIRSPLQDTTRSITNAATTKAATVSPAEAMIPNDKLTAVKDKDDSSETTKDIHRAVEVYLGHSVDPANLARSRQPIRIGNHHYHHQSKTKKKRSRRLYTGPSLEVTLIVCGVREEETRQQQDQEADHLGSDGEDEDLSVAPTAPPTDATMTIVRMVNRIPLLDGAEANSCGLVQGILQKRRVWNSFGLEVSSTGFHKQRSTDDYRYNEEETRLQVPTFQVRDSEQVLPFLRNANHSLLEDPFANDGDDTESDNDDDVDVEDLFTRKRRRKTGRKWLLPARVRLGNILIMVQIDAEPSQLPLPTLSKVSKGSSGLIVLVSLLTSQRSVLTGPTSYRQCCH